MGTAAYELGRSAALTKRAGLFGGALDALRRGGSWAGRKALGYAKSYKPSFGERAVGVVSRPGGARTLGEGLRSVGSGVAHGLTGGRFIPRQAVADAPFRYARGIADVAFRHPYAMTTVGQMSGVMPEPVAKAIDMTAGLGGKGMWNKAFGTWSAYDLGKSLTGGSTPPPATSAAGVGDPADYYDLARLMMAGREAAQVPAVPPDYWSRVFGGARQFGDAMPGRAGARF